jgi:hypothetical protein
LVVVKKAFSFLTLLSELHLFYLYSLFIWICRFYFQSVFFPNFHGENTILGILPLTIIVED